MTLYGILGVSLTKYTTSAHRSAVNTLRIIIIWSFFMVIPINGKIIESFKLIQLIGFVFLVVGNLVLNELLVIKQFGLD